MTELPLVLVHGGGHGAWCWDRLLPLLTTEAMAVDLPPASIRGGPGRHVEVPEMTDITVDSWARSVLAQADAAGFDRFVLVGHSLGGLTLAATATLAPERVARLVYVSAVAPAQGANVVDLLPDEVMAEMAAMTEQVIRHHFCNDMDEPTTRFVIDHVGTEVINTILEPADRSGVPASLPTTYVRLADDRSLPPATQDECIANLRASPGLTVDVIALESGHNAMLSHPQELADILNAL